MVMPWHQSRLRTILASGERRPHAILIRGPQGIGKLAFAQALAQAWLCERPSASGEGCGSCPGCAWLAQGAHPDFRLLAPEERKDTGEAEEGKERKVSTQIDVGQVRELTGFVNLTSHRGGSRVVVIHPAEALNVNASNALLKGLEEPPPRTLFLLVAHRPHQLLPTVRSRCQEIALAPPGKEAALDWLKSRGIADAELALAHAGGAPLLAAELDDDYWRLRGRLMELVHDPSFDALGAAEELREAAPARMVALLQKWSFDLAFRRAAGRVRYNPDQAAPVAKLAARLDPLEVTRFHRRMVRLQRDVHHPLNARLFLEDLFLACAALLRATAPDQTA